MLIVLVVPKILHGSPMTNGYLFEEDMIAFKTNSCHLLFRQLKNVFNTHYGSLMDYE